MKINRNRKSKKGRIEIIAMIDVMFFLLVTFMLASISMQRVNGLAVNLPKGKADSQEVQDKITFSINKNNEIFLGKEKIEIANLSQILAKKIANKDLFILINSDKKASHGVVMAVMIEAKKAGAKHFSILSEE